jgi:methyltransferase (TIGR00027 family)
MRAGAGSDTAIFTALQRAAHQIIDEPPRILEDPVAVGLVPGSTEEAIRNAAEELQRPAIKLLRSTFVFRSRFAEDALQDAVVAGTRQVVLLGAGFDTFAYRQPPWAKTLRIFEVDHPASQAFKKRRLAAMGIVPPANVSFCPIDFEIVSLQAGLRTASFDDTQPAFFSWLGVTQYLTRDAVLGTLGFVRSLATGTRIAFEVLLPESMLPENERTVARFASEASAARGEPWLSRFAPEEMRALLEALGYRSCLHLTPREAQARYFEGRRDGLTAPEMAQFLIATV